MKKDRKVSLLQTWVIIPDTHFQAPMDSNGTFSEPAFCHDPEAISLMLQYIDRLKCIHGIIHIGDIMEMDCISHWSDAVGRTGQVKDTNGNWYKASWRAQKAMVYAFWHYLAKKYPKAKRVQLEGNHDQWSRTFFSNPLFDTFKDDPEFNPSNLAFHKWSIWKDLNIEYVPYWGGQTDSTFTIQVPGKKGLIVMHGFNKGSVKKMYKDFDNVVYGHTHKLLQESYDGNFYEGRQATSVGCLTKLLAEYNSNGGDRNQWAHGFGLVHLYSNGITEVRVVRIQRRIPTHNITANGEREFTELFLPAEDGEVIAPVTLASIDPTLSVLDY